MMKIEGGGGDKDGDDNNDDHDDDLYKRIYFPIRPPPAYKLSIWRWMGG